MEKKKFVFNDERITNSYRFRVLTSGIKLGRFLDNPVMLADHYNSMENAIGRWEETTVSGGLLTGVPVFDTEDPLGKLIAGKVERNFVKACSMGISYNRENMEQQPDGSWLLKECELMEVSVCAVPANAGALRLYDNSTKKLLSEDEVKLSLENLFVDNSTQNKNMEKITLSVASLMTLGLQQQPATAQELDTHIANLATKLKNEQDAHTATKTEMVKLSETQAKELIKQAKLSGKILEAETKDWEDMAKKDLSLASAALAKIPAKRNLQAGEKPEGEGGETLPKTVDEFEKLSTEAKLAFKANNPAEHEALFKRK